MSGYKRYHKKSKTKSPKDLDEIPDQNVDLKFTEYERNTVLGIFDILLADPSDESRNQCIEAMEKLFTLAYRRHLVGKIDQGIKIHPVIREAVQKFNVTAEDILGPKTSTEMRDVRLWIVKRLRQRGMSYPRIGKILHRTHSTIMAINRTRR